MTGTALATEDTAVNKIKPLPSSEKPTMNKYTSQYMSDGAGRRGENKAR